VPVATSSNGHFFVFKFTADQIDHSLDRNEQMKIYMRLSLLKMTIFGFKFMKHIDIVDSMDECGEKNYSKEIGTIRSNIKIDVMVNDDSDICAKITKKLKKSN